MRKNKSLLALTFFSLSIAHADDSMIKAGLKRLGTVAKGPEVACEDITKVPLSSGYRNQGADCSAFIKADGSLGSLGNTIVDHIKTINGPKYFENNLPGVQSFCPKWPSLTRVEKEYFWVWLFAAISFKETTCGANTINRAATHGTAVGHLQLNQPRRDRYWRGGESGKSCGVPDIAPAQANIKCGLEILNEQLKGKDGAYKGNGSLFGPGAHSYWHHLRLKKGGTIIKLLRDFPLCK